MSKQQEETDTGSVSSSGSCEHRENDEWPNRGRFRKSYHPYGVRICEATLEEIDDFDDCRVGYNHQLENKWYVTIETRGGEPRAYIGDWIMEDSEGHHYPIADDEIRQTYEPVNED